MAVDNVWQNTKYILNSISLQASPKPPTHSVRAELKQKLNKAKTYDEFFAVVGAEPPSSETLVLEELLPSWIARRKAILDSQ